jgi:hypothetical protein
LANPSPLLPEIPAKFWHATCSKNGMAKKTNTLKMLLDARESARQTVPPTTALYLAQLLAQLRPHTFKIPPPRARLQIAIQIEEPAPRVVKIIHAGSF